MASPSPGGVGTGALEAMRASHEEEKSVFKKPLVPKGRVKKRTVNQVVLDEDSYTQELANIIERDFFPDLADIRERSQPQAMTPNLIGEESPATFETPERTNAKKVKDKFWDKVDQKGAKKLSLDQFLNMHTSEDNESFNDILSNAEEKRRQKYSWLYGAEAKHANEREMQLALPSIEDQAKGIEKPLNVDGWNYKSQNYIMYIPDGVSLTEKEKVEMAAQRHEVVAANTRLTSSPFNDAANRAKIVAAAQIQARANEGRIGVDGQVVASATPQVKGFSFVRTPSPAPGRGGETPVMTWGEIEGTPCRLDTPSFRMADTPRREQIAHELADKAGQRHRDLKLKAIQAARKNIALTPGSKTPLLSPAAQRLASAHKVGDRALRASYTPQRTPGFSTPTPKTPICTPKRTMATAPSTPQQGKITDDLLNLPKRVRAETFFK
ncbi:splicing factor ESS-2 homolog [Neocloeon triangulifer]|uniref:splicing factor ESS-2 homolog n=1 Tax=Neocloeon triangulifer TaxID=2078957 RepID=UPI00286EB5C5|nr:splicing factor ESS-2 homolog [Neocloeon triangulifer]